MGKKRDVGVACPLLGWGGAPGGMELVLEEIEQETV